MPDLTRVDAAEAVEITDGSSQSVKVRTAQPSSGDEGLVVREAARGQVIAANSMPVVLASDQASSATTTPGGSAVGLVVREAARGQATMANSMPAVLPSDQVTNATATPASNANAIVVREAARGQQISANSIPVVLASDQKSADSPQVDGLGNSRVSSPFSVFDSDYVETDNSLYWDSTLTTGGTLTRIANESGMRLTTTTSSGSKVVYRTKEYFSFQPGKSTRICISAVMGALKANVRQRIGYFDDNNGVFWEQDGTNLKVAIRTFTSGSAVTSTVNQSSWNLDKLNGTGASGITIDMSKIQTFIIDFSWLGSQRIRLGFQIDGSIYYCHQFLTANSGTTVSMQRGILPIALELENTAGAASGTNLYVYASSVNSEGGYNRRGICRSVSNGVTTRNVTNTTLPLISLRLKSANNRGTIIPLGISLLTTNNEETYWQLLLNTSLTGASFSSVSSTAISEFDVSATAISGGETIAAGFANNGIISFDITPSIALCSNIAGTADILSLVAVRVTANATCSGMIYYKEVF